MTRIKTGQAAVAAPVGVYIQGLAGSFNGIIDVPDYSVPDPNQTWPDRDPNDSDRRIQPGVVTLFTPMLLYNSGASDVTVEVRIVPESGSPSPTQLVITIPPGDTYQHPIAGQTLVKSTPNSANGDSLQVKEDGGGVVHLTLHATRGSAQQDQPE